LAGAATGICEAARKAAIYFRRTRAGWLMTSTLNYALGAVLMLGLLAVTLAIMVW